MTTEQACPHCGLVLRDEDYTGLVIFCDGRCLRLWAWSVLEEYNKGGRHRVDELLPKHEGSVE